MIRLALELAMPLLGSTMAGLLFVRRVWADDRTGFGLALGAALGAGFSGATYFLVLSLLSRAKWSFAASECLLVIAIAGLFVTRKRNPSKQNSRPLSPFPLFFWPFCLIAILAFATLVFYLDVERSGGWDALAMWNLKARFILLSPDAFLRLFDVASANPDYPLLLPSLLARGWKYAGSDTWMVPLVVAGFFTTTVGVLTVTGLRMVTSASQTYIAGGILLSTPFFLGHGASQYADIVMCCFISAAVLPYCIHDTIRPLNNRLPILAGAAASFAACTKNEGILFLVVLVAVRILLGLLRRTFAVSFWELLNFAAGAALGLITLLAFKVLHSPPNVIVNQLSFHVLSVRVGDFDRHLKILKGFQANLQFGAWAVSPLPWMVAHMAVSWRRGSDRSGIRPWWTPVLVLTGMLAGYYTIYLLSPYALENHLGSSLDRLFLQIWPVAIVGYSMIVAPPTDKQAELL